MRKVRMLLVGVLLLLAARAWAQEKPKPEEPKKPLIPLKVQIVFSEYDGEKKVASLPYTFFVNANDRMDRPGQRPGTRLRMGERVPVVTGASYPTTPATGVSVREVNAQFQYIDVGSNIDCFAWSEDDGRYPLSLTLERSSVFSVPGAKDEKLSGHKSEDVRLSAEQPVIRQFRTEMNLILKDGQTVENVMSTDPLNGRVLRVSVTLSVVK